MFPRISIQKVWENGIPFLEFSFRYHEVLKDRIRKLPKSRWDAERRIWITPFRESELSEFFFEFGEWIDCDLDILLIPLKTELTRRNYSKRTQRSYNYTLKGLFRNNGKHLHSNTEQDLRAYIDHLHLDRKLSARSIRGIVHGIKFYYQFIVRKEVLRNYSLPKIEKRIPESLTKEEVKKIVTLTTNPKHRLILELCYGSGLRVSEVVELKGIDFDWARKSIRIRQGKGKKDRFTTFPEQCKIALQEAIERQGEKNWIFPGAYPGSHLSIRSAEKIFSNAKLKARIGKDVSIHDLRHAFAIHLLESGTSIKVIQMLLGHASVKTTEIYARIVNPSVSKIKSPLDEP